MEAVLRSAPPRTLTISSWTLVEFASTLAGLARMGTLEGDPRVIQQALEEHAKHVYLVHDSNAEDHELARDLLLRDPGLGLRGPDALHLAIAARRDEIIYTLDRALLTCAKVLNIPATSAGILGQTK